MTDGYDLFCSMHLLETKSNRTVDELHDDIACACAKYLEEETSMPNKELAEHYIMSINAELLKETN